MTLIATGATKAAAEILETAENCSIRKVVVTSLYTMTCGGVLDEMLAVVTGSSRPPCYRGLLRTAAQQSPQRRSRLHGQARMVLLGAGGGTRPTLVELCLGACRWTHGE